jgi:hypothetical protein
VSFEGNTVTPPVTRDSRSKGEQVSLRRLRTWNAPRPRAQSPMAHRVLYVLVMTPRNRPSLLALALTLFATPVLAQDPSPPVPPAGSRPVAPAAATPPAAPSGAQSVSRGNIECTLGEHSTIDTADATTAADILCGELAKAGAPAGSYTVTFGKLGSKVSLRVARDGTNDAQGLLLSGVEETPVAAERISKAFATGKSVDESVSADAVISSESRTPLTKSGQTMVAAGIDGTLGAGTSTDPSAGVFLRLLYRSGAVGLTGEARLGGVGSADDKIAHGDLGIGGQVYLGSGDVAPFVGAGLDFSYVSLVGKDDTGSGLGAYGELGVEFMRTNRTGLLVAARADAPFYAVRGTYVAPLSLNLGLVFR